MKRPLFILGISIAATVLAVPLGLAQEKVRVFIAGTSAQAETIHHLKKRCPEFTVTEKRENADYKIVHDDTGAGKIGRAHV